MKCESNEGNECLHNENSLSNTLAQHMHGAAVHSRTMFSSDDHNIDVGLECSMAHFFMDKWFWRISSATPSSVKALHELLKAPAHVQSYG